MQHEGLTVTPEKQRLISLNLSNIGFVLLDTNRAAY